MIKFYEYTINFLNIVIIKFLSFNICQILLCPQSVKLRCLFCEHSDFLAIHIHLYSPTFSSARKLICHLIAHIKFNAHPIFFCQEIFQQGFQFFIMFTSQNLLFFYYYFHFFIST